MQQCLRSVPSMLVEARFILRQLGVINPSGVQTRPVSRDDLKEIIEQNGGSAKFADLQDLNLKGADLRGLDLRNVQFRGCDLTDMVAEPLVKYNGKELQIGDGAIQVILAEWAKGKVPEGAEVKVTKMSGAVFTGAMLNDARFSYAQLQDASFHAVRTNGTTLYEADLSRANFRFSRFIAVDWQSANLQDANLYGLQLETIFLDDIKWGDQMVVGHEKEGDWDEAIHVYRVLARAHELAGMNDIAAEFRYRREQVQSSRTLSQALSHATVRRGRGTVWHYLSALLRGGSWSMVKWLSRSFLNMLFGFGERPSRVVWAILLVAGLFGFIYFDYSGTIEPSVNGLTAFLEKAGQAIYFSAASSTALGYGSWVGQELGWVRYLGVVQSFVGTFLNALFLVTITRRWMR